MLNEVDPRPADPLVAAHLAVVIVAPVDPALGRALVTAVPQDQAVAQVMETMEVELITRLQSLSQAQESDTEPILDTTLTTTVQQITDMIPITAPTAIPTITTATTIKAW